MNEEVMTKKEKQAVVAGVTDGLEEVSNIKELETKLNSEQAIAILEADRKERCEAANEELKRVCEKYKVQLIAITQIAGNQISQGVQFIPQ
jgi:Zn-dependent metalloprotease